jgi:hypothetical protein
MRPLLFILIIFLSLFAVSCLPGKKFSNWDQKEVRERYSGGHKWDITLTLYKDSTFRYVSRDDMLGIPKIKTGVYLKTDSIIDLYTWQQKYLSRKSELQSYRLKGSSLLLFSREDEMGKDSSFMKAYYTLRRDE